MAGYVNGGKGTLPLASTNNVLNSTGFDRLLLIHVGPNSANTLQIWNLSTGTVPLTTTFFLSSGTIYDVGPFFFGSSEALLGGAATSSGSYFIDEMRF